MESKSKDKGPGIIEFAMYIWGAINLASGMIWTFTSLSDEEPDIWAWFSRYALGVMCFGFAGVIREIRKSRNND
jgi:hypothetical protein